MFVCQANKTSMSWISSEMMRDRSSGPFENYGEMLYAESLEAMQRKREKVCAAVSLSVCGWHTAQLETLDVGYSSSKLCAYSLWQWLWQDMAGIRAARTTSSRN
jgi:hypothetical protein